MCFTPTYHDPSARCAGTSPSRSPQRGGRWRRAGRRHRFRSAHRCLAGHGQPRDAGSPVEPLLDGAAPLSSRRRGTDGRLSFRRGTGEPAAEAAVIGPSLPVSVGVRPRLAASVPRFLDDVSQASTRPIWRSGSYGGGTATAASLHAPAAHSAAGGSGPWVRSTPLADGGRGHRCGPSRPRPSAALRPALCAIGSLPPGAARDAFGALASLVPGTLPTGSDGDGDQLPLPRRGPARRRQLAAEEALARPPARP